jgi:hypothetical protein
VLDAARHDEQVARAELDDAVAELHAEAAAVHEEQLVGVVVVVPDEGALQPGELDVLAVERRDHVRAPRRADAREGVGEGHGVGDAVGSMRAQ